MNIFTLFMMQYMKSLLLFSFVFWTCKALDVLPKPTFHCSHRLGGCTHKMDLAFSTLEKWNVVSSGKIDGDNEDAVFGASGSIALERAGFYCAGRVGGDDFGVERIGFYIKFDSNATEKKYDIGYPLKSLFVGEVNTYDWEEVRVDIQTDCDLSLICVATASQAMIKNFYVQICLTDDQGEDIDPPAGSHIPSNETCIQPPELSTMYTSVAKGVPMECPAQEFGCQFKPYINLVLTNAHYVKFICLNKDGNETAWDTQTINFEGTYIVVSGDIGNCFEVMIKVTWYQGIVYSVDNVDVSVCAGNNACEYHVCDQYGITSTAAP